LKIDLTKREVPPSGELPGVFIKAEQVLKSDKRGKSNNTLRLVGELEAVKSNGKRFIADATYNLDDTRGIDRLTKVLKIWRGSDALPDLGDFDPETEFVGKRFVAEPVVEDKGGKRLIKLTGIKPVNQPTSSSTGVVQA
jgi:hypothetical protein